MRSRLSGVSMAGSVASCVVAGESGGVWDSSAVWDSSSDSDAKRRRREWKETGKNKNWSSRLVVPAKAGTQAAMQKIGDANRNWPFAVTTKLGNWVPAFAGTTISGTTIFFIIPTFAGTTDVLSASLEHGG